MTVDSVPELTMSPLPLSTLVARYGLGLCGRDREIETLGTLSARTAIRDKQLTYASERPFLEKFLASPIAACIVPESWSEPEPERQSLLTTTDDPEALFYTIFADLVGAGSWKSIEEYRGSRLRIAASAVICEPVSIDDDCVIMDHVVLFPNTRLGRGVIIKPNTTIGGDGFEAKSIHGRRRIVPHAGGVWIGDDVEIGSSTAIDCGLFGEFTEIGRETKIDNLVHVAHGVRIGHGSSLIACSEVSGSTKLGAGVWLGPNASINQGLNIADHCFIGSGAVVTRSLPKHSLAFGSPAKVRDFVCACRNRLNFVDGRACCSKCELSYVLENDGVEQVSE